jgi:hypothetical protein
VLATSYCGCAHSVSMSHGRILPSSRMCSRRSRKRTLKVSCPRVVHPNEIAPCGQQLTADTFSFPAADAKTDEQLEKPAHPVTSVPRMLWNMKSTSFVEPRRRQRENGPAQRARASEASERSSKRTPTTTGTC